jgi:tRNA G46 methylase TrmB
MKRIIRLIINFISIFKPSSIYKILVHLYGISKKANRTTEIIRIIEENNYNSFLEVGVWQGENLIPIAKNFPKVKCYGVDPYSGNSFDDYYKGEIMAVVDASYYNDLYQNIIDKTSKLKNVEFIRATSAQAAVKFENESLDVVFIDARHDYQSCKNDILTWLPKVRKGGIIWS